MEEQEEYGVEPKENKCTLLFFCSHTEVEPCSHFSGNDQFCSYRNENYDCESNVAQINKMIITLKKAGFKLIKDL